MPWLDPKTKETLCAKLATALADTHVLAVKTLNYHWNMTGPEFFMHHRLLEEQYKEMNSAADDLAEKIRMLGGKAPATLAEFLKLTSQKEGDSSLPLPEMVKDLAHSNTQLVEQLHETIAYCDDVKDQGTSDLLVERLRAHDKNAWLLRSHFPK